MDHPQPAHPNAPSAGPPPGKPPDFRALLASAGEMGGLIASTDWSAAPLGPIETWPQSLRTTLATSLHARVPLLILWGRDLTVLYNDAYRPILGDKHPASLGAAARDVWPEVWPAIGPTLEGVLATGRSAWNDDLMLPLRRKGFAEECHFNFSCSPIHEGAGVGGVFCAVTETTDARALLESQRIFSTIYNKAAFPMALTKLPEGVIVDVNAAWLAMSGFERAEVVGKTALQLGILPDPSVRSRILAELESRGSVRGAEAALRMKSGERVLWMNLDRVEIGGGLYILTSLQDVTERKRAEEALREQERRQRLVMDALPVLISYVDDQERYRFNNRLYGVWFGLSAASLEGRSIRDVVGDAAYERLRPYVRLALSGHELSFDMEIPYKDGGPRHVSVSYVPDRSDGAVRGFYALIADITERHRAEEHIRRLNAELEGKVLSRTQELVASNGELEAFCYSVAHDLRAPLRAIDGFSQVLARRLEGRLDAGESDHFGRIRAASQKMAQLIDGLLELARLVRAEMRHDVVDLSRMAESILAELRTKQPGRRVEVDVQPGLEVVGDKRLLQALLFNLLDNAWKFTGKQEAARIAFGAEEGEGGRTFFVRDDGAGFDMAYVGRLFKPFERLHVDVFPGTGIGLATVQRIVQRHGGRIWAEGAPGRGAKFSFTLAKDRGPLPGGDRRRADRRASARRAADRRPVHD